MDDAMFDTLMGTLAKGRSINSWDGSRKKIETRVAKAAESIESYCLRSNRKMKEVLCVMSLKELLTALQLESNGARRVDFLRRLIHAIYRLGLKESLETLRFMQDKSSNAEKLRAESVQDASREATEHLTMADKPASQDAATGE
jgi:hypothetical protein